MLSSLCCFVLLNRYWGISEVIDFVLTLFIFKGGPEPLEKESHEFLGSKRDDRFSNPFF